VARPSSDDTLQTEPHRAVDPDARLTVHGELTGDDLVAAVFADPDSDAPRLVYGDYLLERSDPRGELIQLQLQRHASGEPATQREHDLMRKHVQSWTEPLWPGLDASSIRFVRGFLHTCRTLESLALRDTIGHPMWSTVERIESAELGLVVSPCMRALRSVRTRMEPFHRLVHVDHPLLIERVEVSDSGVVNLSGGLYQRLWDEITKVGALTALRELALDTSTWRVAAAPSNPAMSKLLESRLGHLLRRLEVWCHEPLLFQLPPWEHALREHPTIRSFGCCVYDPRVRYPEATVLLERADDGPVGVVLELPVARVPTDETLHVLQSFAATAHRTLAIRYRPGDPEIDSAALEAIRRRVTPTFREVEATPHLLRRRS
jgi:uncharacterized protein (TIGR02996 family)